MSLLTRLMTAAILMALPIPASAFEIDFTRDGLAPCSSGNPGTVPSPAFAVKDVPEGTAFIRFKLVDRDVPGFNHGGGVVAYAGGEVIPAGQFNYKQPCPPDGVHRYEWTATAQTKKNGGKLAVARAARPYPE